MLSSWCQLPIKRRARHSGFSGYLVASNKFSIFWDKVSYNPGWLWKLCVAKEDMELLMVLLPPPLTAVSIGMCQHCCNEHLWELRWMDSSHWLGELLLGRKREEKKNKMKKWWQCGETRRTLVHRCGCTHIAASKTFKDRFAIHSSNSTSVYITAGIKPVFVDLWSVVLIALFTVAKK